MINSKKQAGNDGERAAANYLLRLGFEVLAMNYQNPTGRRLGEIDIIARNPKKNEIIFVEVKTRDFKKYAETLPEENVTWQKIKKLNRIAESYLKVTRQFSCNYRFDVVSVWLDYATRKAKIKHIRNI